MQLKLYLFIMFYTKQIVWKQLQCKKRRKSVLNYEINYATILVSAVKQLYKKQ